ncbi:hypothetical protein Hypma_004126 [Hypsizygus marmoreus]|uniref:Uncharacterized protein n=1 Tax=Hypsizygus marmoreus TaxID=39966 RepID=A0A369J7X9_HYPMA|nr:hypothetical protein Hypma_004126 [Hypsizygus marmoreus]
MSKFTITPVSLTIGPDTRFSSLQTQLASSDDAELLLTVQRLLIAPASGRNGAGALNDRTLKNIVQLDRSLPSTTDRWLAMQPSALQNLSTTFFSFDSDVRAGRISTCARTPGRRRTANVLVVSRRTQCSAQHALPSVMGGPAHVAPHRLLDDICARLLAYSCARLHKMIRTQMPGLELTRNGTVDESESEGNCTKRADRTLRLLGDRGSQLGGRCDARMTMKNHKVTSPSRSRCGRC